ncbi:hypothetical protein [Enterobacter roggenkampii]|uniref:hypothetical protein n=1 Tax=Enterobacter roggenkampii TaxID=1812935 RepID=UPI00084BFD87|nr:hypothetical protein [Enterobacter roggenkampii]AOP95914.1 hypothetical protein BFV67_12140 [Enterobacter roggenkampii]QWZ73979.1 hypothetical protein I6L60_04965 [Enterobacter roggenkampii]
MTFKLIKHTLNVVWISNIITPLMFSPEWFKRYDLLREEDLSNCATSFDGDSITTDYGWVEINCTPTKAVFQLTKTGLESSLADLTSSIFAMFQHAETQAVGINTLFDYHFTDEDEWNKLGDTLVPKNHWIESNNSKILQEDAAYHYGMRTLIVAIQNTNKSDDAIFNETINVTYAPYRKSNPKTLGLNVQYNHDLVVEDRKNAVDFTQTLPEAIQRHIAEAVKNDMVSHEQMFNRILS